MLRTAFLCLGVVLALPGSGHAQAAPPASGNPAASTRHPEEGRPFIRHYRPTEVGGGGQTWTIVQDKRGVLYVATNGAILEFDGATWRRMKIEASGAVRSLAIDESGRIYVGGVTTFGYLEPDGQGELQYVRLDTRLPQEARTFNDVWRTFVTKEGTLFQTERAIFRWAANALTVIHPASRFNRASMVDDRLYVTTPEAGLSVLEGDAFLAPEVLMGEASSVQYVRLSLAPRAMAAFGIPVVDPSDDRPVAVEALVGIDGIPRAIRYAQVREDSR